MGNVLHAALPSWYPYYRDVTLKTVIIPLPDHFLRWLKTDGLSLPAGTPTHIFCSAASGDDDDDDDDEEEEVAAAVADDDNDSGEGTDDDKGSETFDFRDLNAVVKEAIASLGGTVFPKLNWSAPQDAAWLNMGTLKCTAPGDVYALLKSSDFVSHDLNYPFDGCLSADGHAATDGSARQEESSSVAASPAFDYTLVLRRWCNLRPERSFRCFVRERRVVGICQRDCTAHFPQLTKAAVDIEDGIVKFLASTGRATERVIEQEQEKIATAALASGDGASIKPGHSQHWWERRLVDRYPDENFVIDVYVDQRLKVFLIDCNVYGGTTDSLLFSWDQPPLALHENADSEPSPPPPTSALASSILEPGAAAADTDASTVAAGSGRLPPPVAAAAASTAHVALRLLRLVDDPASADDKVGSGHSSAAAKGMDGEAESRNSVGGAGPIRAARFSDYRAPIEMHRFASAMSGGGGADSLSSGEDLKEFLKFVKDCEAKDNTNEGGADTPPNAAGPGPGGSPGVPIANI